jgi:hypothetical protein
MPKQLIEEEEPVNVCFYGEGGSGKTTDLAALAGQGKIWIANAESGVKARALRKVSEELGIEIPIENIEVFPDPSQGEELTYEGLENEWKRIREELHEDPAAYVGVHWDSLTEIQQHMKDIEMARSLDKANRRGIARDPFVVDQDNWRTINEECRALIRKFRDLPCSFGASALQRREVDNGEVVYVPAVTPGLQNDLIGWFDVICHTEEIMIANETFYIGQFVNAGKFRGKDRFHTLPKKLVNPTYPRVVAYVNEEITVEDDEEMQALKAAVTEANSELPAAA